MTDIYTLLRHNDRLVDAIKDAISLEEANPDTKGSFGWEWFDVHTSPLFLKQLVEARVLDVRSSSRSSTYYRLHNIEEAKRTVSEFEAVPTVEAAPLTELPPDLFDVIVGLEDTKELLKRSLLAPKPVHVLLVGPLASAKSLFLQEVSRLPGARFALGGSSTRAGIEDFILEQRPRFLLLDELDKMQRKDFSVLYSLLEMGLVTRMKKYMTDQEHVDIKVYAAANTTDTIPPEILSRFAIRRMPEYDEEMYKEVVVTFLMKRENIEQGLAQYIADKLAPVSRDPRQARHIARLCSTKEQVDRILSDRYYKVS